MRLIEPSKAGREDPEVIPCRLCRRSYRRITGSHLYWKHHLETSDYRERFPNAPFFAEENKRELSQSIIRAWERVGRHWTKERVRQTIRTLQRKHHPLHSLAVKRRRADLYTAAIRLYGSWDFALTDAGVAPGSVRRKRVWTNEKLLEAMRQAARSGELRAGAFFRRRHSGMVQTAVQRWGSWRAALAAAGLPPLRPESVRWTRKVVVQMIRERAERGESLLATEMHSHAPALRSAGEFFFKKGWPDVVRALGYEYTGRKRWSSHTIVQELQRLSRSGQRMNCASVRRLDPALVQAAARRFGAWPVALRAAGIDPSKVVPRHWSREDLRRLFRSLRRSGRLNRMALRRIRRRGYVDPTTSALRYWKSLRTAFERTAKG